MVLKTSLWRHSDAMMTSARLFFTFPKAFIMFDVCMRFGQKTHHFCGFYGGGPYCPPPRLRLQKKPTSDRVKPIHTYRTGVQFLAISARGTRAMFHSALVFISSFLSVLFICTASVICLNMASFRNVPVIAMLNCCIRPPCCSTQCRHNGELSRFLPRRCVACWSPRV